MAWSTNASRVKAGMLGAGLDLTLIAYIQTIVPAAALSKIPIGAKIGILAASASFGIGVEVISTGLLIVAFVSRTEFGVLLIRENAVVIIRTQLLLIKYPSLSLMYSVLFSTFMIHNT